MKQRKWWRSQCDRLNCYGVQGCGLAPLRLRLARVKLRKRYFFSCGSSYVAAGAATYQSDPFALLQRRVARVTLRKWWTFCVDFF
jgi:hypothetical protein